MDYAHLPILVDLSDKQAGADLNQMSSAVDGVIVKMGEADPNNAASPKYDPSFHVHINNAYLAQPKRLPAGAYYILNTNMWQNVTLSALQTMKRMDNPNYVFMYNTLQNKAVNFIALIMQYGMSKDASNSVWLIQDLDTLYRNLREGMRAGEIPTMPIVICTNEKYVNTYLNPSNFHTWIAQHEADTVDVCNNAVQVWVQDYSSIIAGTPDVWANAKLHVAATSKPKYVMNGIPSWFLWQIGSIMFPKDATGTLMYFGLNTCFVALERLYAWMKYNVTPPDTKCEAGFHKDPVTGECVKDVPNTDPDLQQVLTKLDTVLENQATLWAALKWLAKQ